MLSRLGAPLLFYVFVLAGCAEIPTTPIDVNRAELMPEAVAKKILSSWVPNYSGGEGLYILDRYYRIKDVKRLEFYHSTFTHGDALGFFAPDGAPGKGSYAGFLCKVPLPDARKIAEALTALGASVTLYEVHPIGGLIDCGDVRG